MDNGGGARWSAHAADLIQWFQKRRADLPAISFLLNAWTSVGTSANFYAALDQDIAQGPLSARAGALVDDLEDLLPLWSKSREGAVSSLADTR